MFLLNEVCLTYKTKAPITSNTPVISGPEDAFRILKQHWETDINMVERFKVLLLDTKNRVIGISNFSQGGMNGTVVDSRILFATALQALATAMIIAHNHPSGDVQPSKNDEILTDRLMRVGKDLDLPIIDHLIVSPDSYYSFGSKQFFTYD